MDEQNDPADPWDVYNDSVILTSDVDSWKKTVNRPLLRLHSKVFRELLEVHRGTLHSIQLSTSAEICELLLEFMYKESTTCMQPQHVIPLLSAVHRYKMTYLPKYIRKNFEENLEKFVTSGNLLNESIQVDDLKRLKELCKDIVMNNAIKISFTKQITKWMNAHNCGESRQLGLEFLSEIMKPNKIHVSDTVDQHSENEEQLA